MLNQSKKTSGSTSLDMNILTLKMIVNSIKLSRNYRRSINHRRKAEGIRQKAEGKKFKYLRDATGFEAPKFIYEKQKNMYFEMRSALKYYVLVEAPECALWGSLLPSDECLLPCPEGASPKYLSHFLPLGLYKIRFISNLIRCRTLGANAPYTTFNLPSFAYKFYINYV